MEHNRVVAVLQTYAQPLLRWTAELRENRYVTFPSAIVLYSQVETFPSHVMNNASGIAAFMTERSFLPFWVFLSKSGSQIVGIGAVRLSQLHPQSSDRSEAVCSQAQEWGRLLPGMLCSWSLRDGPCHSSLRKLPSSPPERTPLEELLLH